MCVINLGKSVFIQIPLCFRIKDLASKLELTAEQINKNNVSFNILQSGYDQLSLLGFIL